MSHVGHIDMLIADDVELMVVAIGVVDDVAEKSKDRDVLRLKDIDDPVVGMWREGDAMVTSNPCRP
eukprot:1415853-Amphidinium_carterae.1